MSAACRKRKSLKTLPPSKAAIFSGSPRSSVCVVPHGRTPPTWQQSYWQCVPHSRKYCNHGSSASFPTLPRKTRSPALIGREQVSTPVTKAHLVSSQLLEKIQ